MNITKESEISRLATATTLKREPIANAKDAAVTEVSNKVKTKIKNLAGSI